jgi:hypothetical protein
MSIIDIPFWDVIVGVIEMFISASLVSATIAGIYDSGSRKGAGV